MTRRRLLTCAVAMFTLPVAALADVSGTPTLAVNTMLNLDTGTTASSGGDLLWNGTSLAPQSGAGVFPLGSGIASYNALTQSIVSGIPTNSAPITGAALAPSAVFAFKTKSGNYGKMIINTFTLSGSLTLQFTTFVAAGPTGPVITSIQNNYGQVPQGLPNYGIAPSTLFFVQEQAWPTQPQTCNPAHPRDCRPHSAASQSTSP